MTAIPASRVDSSGRGPVLLFGALVLVAVALFAWALLPATDERAEVAAIVVDLPNQAHANGKHPEAEMVRTTIKARACTQLQLWFSPSRGTFLTLCQLNGGPSWGGWIARIYSNGQPLCDPSHPYECSVFVADYSYWTWVLDRDGYVPAPDDVIEFVRSLGQ